jgi:sporulation protein YlmC with PRC-barrel domain
MAHYGSLGDHRFTADVPDVRGADVYGSEDEKIGNIEDVIFDHETMEIGFVVIAGGDRSQSHKFLFPVNRIFDDNKHRDGFAIGITKQKSEDFPDFDNRSLESKESWKKYLDEFKKFWEEDPVMHRRGSDRIVTPTPEELRASGNVSDSHADAGEGSGDLEFSAGELFPERMSDVFSDTTPGAHKVTLRPRSVRRAEEAAAGLSLLKPRWDAFAEHLRRDRIKVQSHCAPCAHDGEKTGSAA